MKVLKLGAIVIVVVGLAATILMGDAFGIERALYKMPWWAELYQRIMYYACGA